MSKELEAVQVGGPTDNIAEEAGHERVAEDQQEARMAGVPERAGHRENQRKAGKAGEVDRIVEKRQEMIILNGYYLLIISELPRCLVSLLD